MPEEIVPNSEPDKESPVFYIIDLGEGEPSRYWICKAVGALKPDHELIGSGDVQSFIDARQVKAARLPDVKLFGSGPVY